MKIMQRAKRLWQLSGQDPYYEPYYVDTMSSEEREEQKRIQAEAVTTTTHGDGKAVFLSDFSEDEYRTHVKEEVHGWKGFMDKVLGRV